MEEKKLTDEEIVKALECCYEADILCSKDCPLQGCESCSAIMGSLALDLIHRLQIENKTLKTELRKECEEHEEFTKKAKAEFERLHKVLQEEFVSLKAVKAGQNSPKAMKMLVESVGCVQKDTAKGIWYMATVKIRDELNPSPNEKDTSFSNGVIQAKYRALRIIDTICKERYGVEVE